MLSFPRMSSTQYATKVIHSKNTRFIHTCLKVACLKPSMSAICLCFQYCFHNEMGMTVCFVLKYTYSGK